jgi:hypothetical protein
MRVVSAIANISTTFLQLIKHVGMFKKNETIELLAASRTLDLSEPIDLYLKVAKELVSTNRHNYISRAKFILEQIKGNNGKEIFDTCREDWDIWNFNQNILTADDFKRGFLWCFRDHTTCWNDNQKAKTWFLTSPEGMFVKRYELWNCDNGTGECIEVKEGNYKEILLSLLKEGDYEVLCSPAFSNNELNDFIKTYIPKKDDYQIEVIIEDYIATNPNYEV